MAKMTNLAHPYVNALFDLANSENSLDLWLADLEILATSAHDANFAFLVNNPQISKENVLEILLGLVKNINPSVKNFLNLLYDESRLEILPEIALLFKEKIAEARNSATALIQSAFPMTEADKTEFEVLLTKKLGKKVEVVVEINSELIGGIKILVNDLVIDASVKGGLEKLAAQII